MMINHILIFVPSYLFLFLSVFPSIFQITFPSFLLFYCDNVSSYEELLQRARLPTLHMRRLQDMAIKNGLAPPYITDLFVVSSTHYNLRNSDFIIPRFRTVAYGKHSLSYLGPVLWSKLEKSIRLSDSLEIFKKRIKQVNFNSLLDIECKDCFLCNN